MRRSARAVLATSSLGLLGFGACVPEDIIVAEQHDAGAVVAPAPPTTTDASTDATPGDDEPVPRVCSDSDDCGFDEFCSKRSCDSSRGVCQRKPLSCDDAGVNPVCGCNKLTYFNDCLRQASGVNLARPSECREPKRCGGSSHDDCPRDTYCARLFSPDTESCSSDLPGVCWVLPGECDPSSSSTDRYRRCDDPGAACVDRCTAIESEEPYVLTLRCPP